MLRNEITQQKNWLAMQASHKYMARSLLVSPSEYMYEKYHWHVDVDNDNMS